MIRFSTRRPVAISMVTLAVLLFGMVSLTRLPVTLLPDLSYPTVTVRTELLGAAPTEIETLLSKPIEEAVGVIKGVRHVRSVSQPGQSDVTLEFEWGTSIDYAVLDVREKLDVLELPDDARRPVVLRFDPSEDPILRMGLAFKAKEGQALSPDEAALKRLRRIAEDVIQKPMEGVNGVAAVKISGGLEDEVQVRVDLRRMAGLGLTLEGIAARLKAENANISGGRVDEGSASYLVRTLNQFQNLDEIRDTIVATRADRPIYVGDIAEVRAGFKEREAIIRINGEEAVEIALYKEGDANTVAVAQTALSRLEVLKKNLPAELELVKLYDQSIFIEQAIDSVTESALVGGLLAVLVLYLFLRNAWVTAVVSVTIPATVIATFNLMYALDITLNIMSLGGIALAVGMLVDNAIVILENVARKRDQGLSVLDAAEQGSSELIGAVTASTLTSVAVFFPMVFVAGIAGQLFADQALVVSIAQVVSLAIGLTVVPMLAARQVRRADQGPVRRSSPSWRLGPILAGVPGWVPQGLRPVVGCTLWLYGWLRWILLEQIPLWLVRLVAGLLWLIATALRLVMHPLANAWSAAFDRFEGRYGSALHWALGHRFMVLAVALALFGLSLVYATRLGVELIPPFNQGEFKAELTLAPGTPLERTDEVVRGLSRELIGDERLAANYAIAGSGNQLDANAESGGENFGTLNLVLKPDAFAREAELIDELRQRLDRVPGLEYRFTRPTLFTLDTPLEVEIAGYDLDALARVSEALRTRLLSQPRFTEVETTLAPGQPEIQIRFDQERAARLGLETANLAQRVVGAVQGDIATRYRFHDREIDVLVRAQEVDRSSLEAVRNLVINPDSERPLSLAAVAEVALESGPSQIRRVDQQRVVMVSAGVAYGDLGEAVTELQGVLAGIALPQGVTVTVAGQSEEMETSFRSLRFALLLAVFLVYIVMASQFESLRHPLVILFTIPLAAIGAIFSLYFSGMVLNVIAMIGMIVLAGIVVNNGIVLIDMINRLREEGLNRHDAIVAAGRARLRPIMMTMLTSVLGVLPIALARGEGAEVSAPMAVVIAGGLSVATLLTLFVIPVLYTLIDGREKPAPAVHSGTDPAVGGASAGVQPS